MTENTFWQALRKKLVPRVYALKLNLRFVAGVPDCWLSGSMEDLWLEIKYVKELPAIVDPTKLLTARQQYWIIQRHAEGRRVGVLIGSSDGHVYFPSLSWQTAVTKGTFLTQARKTSEIAENLIETLGEVGCNGVI